jgi:hypothetical protein
MSAKRRWCRIPVAAAGLLALTALPFWPGSGAPVGASSRPTQSTPLMAPRSVPSRPESVLGQVKLNEPGRLVAIIGGTIAAGAATSEQIHIYARSGHVFKLAAAVKPSSSNAAGFGTSMGISGNEMIVGGKIGGIGAAWIFMDTAQGWRQVSSLQGAGNGDYEFGTTVDISGNNAIVGDITGHAYIFHAAGSHWVRSADLSLPVTFDGALLDNVVRIDGTTAFVNADKADEGGSVFIYALNGTKWTQVAQVRGSDVTNGVEVVQSMDASGNTLAIGMPGVDEAGRVYIFTNQSGVWKQTAELKGSDTRANDQFGFDVSLSASTLAVGAPQKSNGGAVYVFSESNGAWTQTHEYTASDERPDDQLGIATAVSDSLVVGGAPNHGSGAVYVFAPGIGTIPPAVPLKVHLGPQVYRRTPQFVRVETLPHAHVALQVTYPGGGGIKTSGTTDRFGNWNYIWIVRAGNKGTATVSVTVTSGAKRRHFTKHFQIL